MASKTEKWSIRPTDVLYEDDHLIVINKPAGLPSQPTPDPDRDNAFAAVGRYLDKNSTGESYVGMHHRLDALTSGILLFTKSRDANESISAQFQNHTVSKRYIAICWHPAGEPLDSRLEKNHFFEGNSCVLDMPIGELPGGKIQKFGINGKKRKPARTEVFCEQCTECRSGKIVVCRCEPQTGRTHQIRVHLAAVGLEIVGDPLYSHGLVRELRSIDPNRMCLHSELLEIHHPVTGEKLKIFAPRSPEFERFIKRAGCLIKARG